VPFRPRLGVALLAAIVPVACGSSGGGPADGETLSPGDGYEAFPPDFPTIENQGGPVLGHPRLVTVTWASDPQAPTLEAFDQALGASSYWKTVMGEYAIGPIQNVAVTIAAAPPAQWADTDIDAWVKQQAQSSTSGWPAPDGETAYIVYLPATVQLTSMGQAACQAYAGYHTDLGTNPDIAYALVPEACYQGTGYSLVDNATSSAAHEIVESATDPFSNQSPAWLGFDKDHLAWELWTEWQDEIADACEFSNYTYFKEGSDLPYLVARIWSNASAQAGHDPCLPLVAGAYFDVAPQGLQDVGVQAVAADGMTVQGFTSKGWRISPGQSATVSVGFFSDAPRSAWSVAVAEGDCCTTPAGLLDISPTMLSGKNGDVGQVTITVKKAPAVGSAISLSFTSGDGMLQHVRPVLVGAY
jgi:hypothetical protein